MAVIETNITHEIQMAASKRGVVLLKNVRGLFLTLDGKRRVASGLQAKGSSDLIGFRPVVITPEMVGSTVAVFCAVEVKTPTGKVSPEQRHFIDVILKNGGFAGVSRSVDDAIRVLKI
jgi:hypothetical protein